MHKDHFRDVQHYIGADHIAWGKLSAVKICTWDGWERKKKKKTMMLCTNEYAWNPNIQHPQSTHTRTTHTQDMETNSKRSKTRVRRVKERERTSSFVEGEKETEK